MDSLTVLGIALLVITFWDYQKDKTNTVFLFEWWAWFDVSRSSSPSLYWMILAAQTIGGVFLIFSGIKNG
jgi:hypothetical protein